MRDPANRVKLLKSLHFALDVMEERAHIGLNDERAAAIRSALQRRIFETEAALHFPPAVETTEKQGTEDLLMA
jgi:hypothetical protein